MKNKQYNSNSLFTIVKLLEDVLSSSFSREGAFKMIHKPSEDIMITKSGINFLKSARIQGPEGNLILSVIEDSYKSSFDGSISLIIFMSALTKECLEHLSERIHPRKLFNALSFALPRLLDKLNGLGKPLDKTNMEKYCGSILSTKLNKELTAFFSKLVTSAISSNLPKNEMTGVSLKEKAESSSSDEIKKENNDKEKEKTTISARNLPYARLIEIVEIPASSPFSSFVFAGIALDHAPRHSSSPRSFRNVYILSCNISLEKEKPAITSSLNYSTAEQAERFSEAEKELLLKKVRRIVRLKERLATKAEDFSFMVLNYAGVEPLALEELHKAGIPALRRMKRRNMERVSRLCGGYCVSDGAEELEDLSCLGWAEAVEVKEFGEEKYTFIHTEVMDSVSNFSYQNNFLKNNYFLSQNNLNPRNVKSSSEGTPAPNSTEKPKKVVFEGDSSVSSSEKGRTIVLCAPTKAKMVLFRESLDQSILAAFEALKDGVVPGAGMTEFLLHEAMEQEKASTFAASMEESSIEGKEKRKRERMKSLAIGFDILSKALLSIPRRLASNKGLPGKEEVEKALLGSKRIGEEEVLDGMGAKRNMINYGTRSIMNFMLVDKIIKPKGK